MVEMLVAYSQGKADVNKVLRALVSHPGWFVPLHLFAVKAAESTRKIQSMITGTNCLIPAGELWIFTDAESVNLAISKGASLGAYGGGMAGTELFTIIDPSIHTVYVNPFSPPERSWMFREGSASTAGQLWAEAIALEESFGQWQQTGTPDETALLNFRAYLLYDHVSGPIITLPNQAGMSNPAAAFTAPDCADEFISALSDEERTVVRQVTIDGKRLLEIPRLGIDGFVFNFFGPGATYALPFASLSPQ